MDDIIDFTFEAPFKFELNNETKTQINSSLKPLSILSEK
jgi:hypothetical protein